MFEDSIIWTVLIGLLVGVIAKFIMPGKDPGGIIVTILIGIGGSFLGNFISGIIKIGDEGGLMGFVMSIVGALIILLVWKKLIAPALDKK